MGPTATVLVGALITHIELSYTQQYNNGSTKTTSYSWIFKIVGLLIMLRGLAVI